MSLTASYYDLHRAAGSRNVTTLPQQWDGSCLFRETGGLVFDALPLGTWCCGSFTHPRNHLKEKMGESATPYWDYPFAWRSVPLPPGTDAALLVDLDGNRWGAGRRGAYGGGGGSTGEGLRAPFWNGTRAFNLHMHSKQLHLWRSTDDEAPRNALAAVPQRN
jgi:hypothetical protein